MKKNKWKKKKKQGLLCLCFLLKSIFFVYTKTSWLTLNPKMELPPVHTCISEVTHDLGFGLVWPWRLSGQSEATVVWGKKYYLYRCMSRRSKVEGVIPHSACICDRNKEDRVQPGHKAGAFICLQVYLTQVVKTFIYQTEPKRWSWATAIQCQCFLATVTGGSFVLQILFGNIWGYFHFHNLGKAALLWTEKRSRLGKS